MKIGFFVVVLVGWLVGPGQLVAKSTSHNPTKKKGAIRQLRDVVDINYWKIVKKVDPDSYYTHIENQLHPKDREPEDTVERYRASERPITGKAEKRLLNIVANMHRSNWAKKKYVVFPPVEPSGMDTFPLMPGERGRGSFEHYLFEGLEQLNITPAIRTEMDELLAIYAEQLQASIRQETLPIYQGPGFDIGGHLESVRNRLLWIQRRNPSLIDNPLLSEIDRRVEYCASCLEKISPSFADRLRDRGSGKKINANVKHVVQANDWIEDITKDSTYRYEKPTPTSH